MPIASIIALISALAQLAPEITAEVQAVLPTLEGILNGGTATEAEVAALDAVTDTVNAKVSAMEAAASA